MTSYRSDLVVVAAAISAGIHGALAPEHLREEPAAGVGFAAAAALLALVAVALTSRPHEPAALSAAALVFAGLLLSYGLAVTSGLPLLHPEPEPVDGLGLVTKAVEAVGLAIALHLIRSLRAVRLPSELDRPEGARA
ncbi:MAG: hypothetical protein ACM33B_03860 [Pseudomonadota bacterium]